MSNIIDGGGIVFGTAGHIDHGKTALVRALTGIDTDRLAEEKKRGISIELGFADLELPTRRRVAIVDVPGHERFIKNMLAGAGGIDAVLLVIAADEGVKPQTREHFEICRLLGVSHGIIVLTKADLASPAQIETLKADIRSFCRNSFLENAPCIPVSAQQSSGIDRLLCEMAELTTRLKPRPATSFARLPIDRSFKMQGFGTVVTGTMVGGSLRVGDTVEIHPLRKQCRIRGIQVHRQSVASASAGERTAVNLVGIEANQIERGAVLIPPDTFESTQAFDAAVEWLNPVLSTRIRQNLRLYVGCADVTADVRLLEKLEGSRTLTRVSSKQSLLVLPGDHFVLRNAEQTVGGGRILDAFPPIRLNRDKTRLRLRALLADSEPVRLRLLVEESTQGRKLTNLIKLTGWTAAKIKRLTEADPTLTLFEAEQRIISLTWLDQKRKQVLTWLEHFYATNRSAKAAPLHQVRSALMSGIEPGLTDFILNSMPEVVISGESVVLAGRVVTLPPEEQAAREKLDQLFLTAAFQPPSLEQALSASGLDPKRGRAQLEALIKEKRLVRIGSDMIFHADVIRHVKQSLGAHKGRRFSVPEFKEWINISRKYAIPLLEFLDRDRVTRREGDARIVL